MPVLLNSIQIIKNEAEIALAAVVTLVDLETFSTKFLGRKGLIAELMQQLKNLSVDDKRLVAPVIQNLRSELEAAVQSRSASITELQLAAANAKLQYFDVTANKPSLKPAGNTHIYSKFIEGIEDIFLSMGFDVWDGPEIETDFYNFSALNLPADHPARDMQDTLWLNKVPYLLRTHTSPIQVHAMETKELPLAGIASGRVFRQEAIDASHEMMFTQCEGLVVDKGINLSNLFGLAQTFLRAMFDKKDLDIRIRPGFFPFVEPGVEIDMRCVFCKNGCKVCKQSTWIEVMPGGLVHPHVLKSAGIDPVIYSGVAFAIGIERMIMLKHGINDIRLFHEGKVGFLKQF